MKGTDTLGSGEKIFARHEASVPPSRVIFQGHGGPAGVYELEGTANPQRQGRAGHNPGRDKGDCYPGGRAGVYELEGTAVPQGRGRAGQDTVPQEATITMEMTGM